MIAAFWFLILLGGTALACGMGPAAWIWPAAFRGKGIDLAGTMMIGFGTIALVSTYLFECNFTIIPAVPLTFALSILLLIVRSIRARSDLKSYLAQAFSFSPKYLLVPMAGMAVGAALVLPSVSPYAGQPSRIGIDQCVYALTGQYLRDGGRLEPLREDIMQQTGQDNLAAALLNNNGALTYNLKAESEILLKAYRVGYPATIGALFQFLGQPLVYTHLFLILFWPTVFSVSIIWFFFHHIIGSNHYLALGYALAISLNCNLLNNACEGQQPQWFIFPYICLFFVLWFIRREAHRESDLRNHFQMTMGLGAAIVLIYSEALMVLASVGGLVLLIDVCLRQWKSVATDGKIGVAIAGGLILTGPFLIAWLPIVIRLGSAAATGHAGYWQPYWAAPAEIMGWIDIYTRPGYHLIENFSPLHLAGIVASLPLLAVNIDYLFRADKRQLAYWLAPILFVAGFYISTCYFHPTLNYAYMKAYTLLAFPLCSLFYIAMEKQWTEYRGTDAAFRKKCLGFLLVAIFGSIVTGGIYLTRYGFTAEKLPSNITDLRELDRAIDFRKVAIITPFYFNLQGRFNLRAGTEYTSVAMLIPFNWLNYMDTNINLAPCQGMPLYIFVLKSGMPGPPIHLPGGAHIVFQNSGFILIDTGYKLSVPVSPRSTRYRCIQSQDPDFVPGCTDSQQYQWKQVLQNFGL